MCATGPPPDSRYPTRRPDKRSGIRRMSHKSTAAHTHIVHCTSLGHTARRAATGVPMSAQAHSQWHEAARAQPEARARPTTDDATTK